MKKPLSALLLLLGCSVVFSGCSLDNDYSDEDLDIVASYVANAVLAQSKGFSYRLETIIDEEPQEEPTVQPTKEPAKQDKKDDLSKDTIKPSSEKENNGEDDKSSLGICEILGAKNVDITCDKFKVYDNYHDGDYFVLEPDKDKKLLVVSFTIKNKTNKKISMSNNPEEINYELFVGDKSYKPLMTALLDDLMYYDGKIDANKSVKASLVFQVDKNSSDKDVSIMISSKDGKFTKKLS